MFWGPRRKHCGCESKCVDSIRVVQSRTALVVGSIISVCVQHTTLQGHDKSLISIISSLLRVHVLFGLFTGLGIAVDTLFVDAKTVILRDLLPGLELAVDAVNLLLEFVVRGTELRDGLLGEKLLECPLFYRLLFVLLELGDVADCICQDGSFVLLTTGHNLGQFVDALVDSLTATTLDLCIVSVKLLTCDVLSQYLPSL